MSEVSDLRMTLVEDVVQIQEEYDYPDLGRAFQHWSAVNILGLEDNSVHHALEGGLGNDGGIDYFHQNEDARIFAILQTKFSENLDAKIKPGMLESFFDIPYKLVNGHTNRIARFDEQMELYKKSAGRGYGTKLIFVITGDLSDSLRCYIEQKTAKLPEDTTFECLTTKDILGLIGNPNTPTCTLELFENEHFASKAGDDNMKKMVATIKASELKKVYKTVGSWTLFSANPRSDLPPNKISRGIRTTLSDEPDKLWHYNNGISAVCDHFDYSKDSNTLKIDNLKIVNGCQTVTTIGKQKGEIDPRASLVFRLSEVKDDKFRQNISYKTNSQNCIVAPDMVANRPELKMLEKKFEKYKPFYWERKRGSLKKNLSIGRGKKNLRVIQNVHAARLKMSYVLEKPHLALQLSQHSLFSDDLVKDEWVQADPGSHEGGHQLSPFVDLYKNADPREFILPHLFYYWLGVIKKELDKSGYDDNDSRDVGFLIKYNIGRYYIIGIIGKIIRSSDADTRDILIDNIIDAAITYDNDIINKIIAELRQLVEWIAHEIPGVLNPGSTKLLHNHEMYELRDKLRTNNKLNDLYHIRLGSYKKMLGHDPFLSTLCSLVATDEKTHK